MRHYLSSHGRLRATALLAAVAVTVMAGSLLAPLPAQAAPDVWRAEGWSKTDFSRITVELAEIISGGPPKDGIPSIDAPTFRSVAEARELTDKDPVLSVTVGGDARTYPLRILTWHEIVNDTVGGQPLTITYCPLCNSGIVFERRLDDRLLDFGTTGKLRHSDLVMYDRQTESWWQQFTGEAIVGALAGAKLKMVPARLESFAEFRARHPDGKVLAEPGRLRPYGTNPYRGYDSSKTPFLYSGEMPDGIEPMARVVMVRREGKEPLAVALTWLRARERVERDGVVLEWRPGQASALDTGQIARGRDVGTVIAQTRVGDRLVDIPYDVTFAFVAHAFHKGVRIVTD